MSMTTAGRSVVRKHADWMRPVDERIMEHLRDKGNLTPQAVENLEVCTRSHASMRMSTLARYGLTERVADVEGLYRLTEEGRAYLDEELDASDLAGDD